MKIGIFETEHFEGSYPVIRLFDTVENHITVFTTEKCYGQFKYLFRNDLKKFDWVVQSPRQSKYDFIRYLFRQVKEKKIDLLYLNTVPDNFIFYAFMIWLLPGTRVVLTIHDINSYFTFNPAFSLRRIVRYTGKRWLTRLVKEFNVVSVTMVDYLKRKLPPQKKVHNVPGSVFDPAAFLVKPLVEGEQINIVVPGTIDYRRRNYPLVFELLKSINANKLPVNLTLLGGYSKEFGMEIIEQCRSYAKENNNLVFFETDVVEQPHFNAGMNNAHFVLLPARIDTVLFDGVTEIYGRSISSGNIFDVIKHARPCIIPGTLAIPPELEPGFFRFNLAQDIIAFVEKFLAAPREYERWQEKAYQNSLNYTVDQVRLRNSSLFGQI